jgi:hypothetical protein
MRELFNEMWGNLNEPLLLSAKPPHLCGSAVKVNRNSPQSRSGRGVFAEQTRLLKQASLHLQNDPVYLIFDTTGALKFYLTG